MVCARTKPHFCAHAGQMHVHWGMPMSKAKEQNNGRPEGNGVDPTRSFDGLVPGPHGQIVPFRVEQELHSRVVGVVHLAQDTALDISEAGQVFRDNYVTADYPRARNYDIAKDGYFLTALANGELITLAFDSTTGAELWRRSLPELPCDSN